MRRGAAMALAGLLVAGCEGVQRTWYIDLERMVQQPRYEPYERSPVFPDGSVMRPPPAGTVARGEAPVEPAFALGRAGGQPIEEIPIPVTMALLVRGRDRFDVYCAVCHGLLGDGESVVAANMQLRPPPSLVTDPIAGYPPGRVYEIVRVGYGLMPSYAAALPPSDRWAVVAYLQALELSQRAQASQLPEPLRERLPRAPAGQAAPR